MYTMYCGNHPYAFMLLKSARENNRNLAKFLLERERSSPETRGLNLNHFLLTPIQRICRYPLLVRQILRYTGLDHPDYPNLYKALMKIEAIVSVVNDAAKTAEGVQKMLEIQARCPKVWRT